MNVLLIAMELKVFHGSHNVHNYSNIGITLKNLAGQNSGKSNNYEYISILYKLMQMY